MYYKDKCMYCMDVETGTLIFAILKIIITSLATLCSVGALVYKNFVLEVPIEDATVSDGHSIWGAHGFNEMLVLFSISYSIAFAFAVVLIFGICKRKATLVKSYFVYGIVKMVLAIAAIIGSSYYSLQIIVQLLFLVYLIYAPILYMIYMTYKKFERENTFTAFTNPISVIEKF